MSGAAIALMASMGLAGLLVVEPRADVPWSVAVLAVPAGQLVPTCARAPLAAFVDRGARCETARTRGGSLVVVESPPELEPGIVGALRATLRDTGASLFVEGRHKVLPLPPQGAPRVKRAVPATDATPAGLQLKLAPGAGLFGLEGAALELFVAAALASLSVTPVLDADDAVILLLPAGANASAPPSAPTLEAVRAALDRATARAQSNAQADALHARARGALALRHATVGGRARDRAAAWLATGSSVLEDDTSVDPLLLAARVRVRAFSAAVSDPAGVGSGPSPAAPPASPASPAH